ncbi:MAG TPA: hypothetical protein DDZ80_26330 [Cyanobacteria bacterium UBA8803]|nr:hypothetical protein [Cyanobacteria bacterium UBA9273]HBL61801.1 hypothetical protein [Cyanobacteria bacterium UBA8803]
MMNANTFNKELVWRWLRKIELGWRGSPSVTDYAQTNIQLFNQLHLAGYSEADLSYICDAYEFGLQIFTGRLRGSGKPFLTHLVGTASILVTLHAPIRVVTAGLMHAAYLYGEYGTEERGMTDAKREIVQRAIGTETEELIAGYTNLKWNKCTIPAIRDRVDAMGDWERQILLIRLANELEDHLDLGVLYCGNADYRREYIRSSLYMSVEMAQKLGFPSLAASLEGAFRDCLAAEIPSGVRGRGRNSSFLLKSA